MHDIGGTRLEAGEAEFDELEWGELESPLGETAELELTTELLEVSNEHELERFLGKLISRAGRPSLRLAASPMGWALGRILTAAARKVLPLVGGAAYGAVIEMAAPYGAQLASGAGQLLGLELEGLSHEDREFETARQFVRFASSAANEAAATPAAGSPRAAARAAVRAAAARHAPGLVPALGGQRDGRGARSGRWVRRGNSIVLIGI
jgi:hypothetical protein